MKPGSSTSLPLQKLLLSARLRVTLVTIVAALAALSSHARANEGGREESDASVPTREYFAYVCAESEDEVSLIQFGPGGAEVAKTIEVGSFPRRDRRAARHQRLTFGALLVRLDLARAAVRHDPQVRYRD